MTEAVWVAIITGGLAVLSNVLIAVVQNGKTIYRIDQLEKKVEKHNNLVERVALLERDEKENEESIKELREILTKLP